MFLKAIPVYPKGLSKKMNTFVTFKAAVENLKGTRLHISAASFYQLWVNGRFVAFGPARTALGYAREDIISLDEFDENENRIEISVNGSYCQSFDGVRQPSFLQAELRRGDEVIFATGENLAAYEDPRKIRKAPRYSKQRHFEEIWDLTQPVCETEAETEPIVPAPKIIDRVTPYPAYRPVILTRYASRGTLEFDEALPFVQRKYSGGGGFPKDWGDYPEEEIEYFPYTWVQQQKQTRTGGMGTLPVTLRAGEYAVLNFGRIECGFFTFSANCGERSDLILAYSEGGSGDRFEFTNMNALNAAEFLLPEGKSDAMTFAPYTGKYVLLAVKSGTVTVNSFGLITYEADTAAAHCPDMGDPVLNAVARGAVRSYAHNAVDLYTDCPSRERAGWLCDSYFTGKTEYYLYGKAPTEAAYLENYRLYENDGTLIDGVLPMCYPGNTEPSNPKDIPIPSHLPQGRFIPQWTMWYILECADHLLERNPTEDREKFRPSIEKLLKFYGEYENEDGLLERLPSWNFVEWSAANRWTADVNYPTNFLYAQVLRRASDLYGDESLRQKAEKIAKTAAAQSMKDGMFRDHALRDGDGNLILQDDCSEICQYYAVLFGGVELKDYPLLRHRILNVFGAERKEDLPEVEPINAFIGVYLRLEALLKIGAYEQVLTDVREFFGAMEQETGTLWEYREGKGSRDHGFASYALPAMAKAVEGLK